MNSKPRTEQSKVGDDDEVNLLLRAAEDELLLNLSVSSHMARGASQSCYMDPDLECRFQALKSSRSTTRSKSAQPPQQKPQPRPKKTTAGHDDGKAKDKSMVVDCSNYSEDDLFARFAALKGSLPSSSRKNHDRQRPNKSNSADEQFNRRPDSGDGVDEDEVQKVIQWAIDAARLDPSPPSLTDDDNDAYSSNADEDSDYDSDDHQTKGQSKKGQKRK